jgi:hypothetical protein
MRVLRSLSYGFVALLLCGALGMAQVAVTTYHNDNYRSGANPHEVLLNAGNVSQLHFGRRAIFPVEGQVYAQPLYVPNLNIAGTNHNVVFIATEHDQVYAFDVQSGTQLWQANFLKSMNPLITVSSVSSNDVNCQDMTPEIGITGTPVIDTTTNTMYMVAITKEYNLLTQSTTFQQNLHALDIRTGADKTTPQVIAATARGTGTGSVGGILTFDPLIGGQRPGLLLENGEIFVGWASHCDLGNYHGWLMAFDKTTLTPGGVFVDTPTPSDEETLDNEDGDVASGGVTLLPDQPGLPYPHLLVQVGKEGTIDLVNRDNMGHWQSGSDSQIVQTLPFEIGGVWGTPAFWNNTAYFGGQFDSLKAFGFDPHRQLLTTSPTSQTPEEFHFPGPTPSVSANEANSLNGIVWVIQSDNQNSGYAVLRAYLAHNLATELYNSEQNPSRDRPGLAVKFAVPTIADGHVFVGAQNQVAMYGILP